MGPPACARHHPAQPLFHAFDPTSIALRGPRRGLLRRSQWHRPHASAPPSTALAPCASPTQYS
eukprot:8146686-Pyramimonas_sp.AAC.1